MNTKLSWEEFITKYDSFAKDASENFENPELIEFLSNLDTIIKNSNYTKDQLGEIQARIRLLRDSFTRKQQELLTRKKNLTTNKSKISRYITNSHLV
ncbi:MAG: hypothetical protein HRU35_02695 [Rickettsiaceae bacterium]|nr:hypothetical protein [Rickettsiaceae bacterium]